MVKQKRIKWYRYFGILVIGIGCVLLNGCALIKKHLDTPSSTSVPENKHNSTISDAVTGKQGFLFVYNGIEIAIDEEAGTVLAALGKEKSYFEADSCAMEGKIRTYSYGSFELDTYEQDGVEHISCIYLKDDMVATKEGISLFMTEEQLFSVYGTEYTIEAGMYVYEKEGMKLKFILSEGVISSIQYTSVVTEVKQ